MTRRSIGLFIVAVGLLPFSSCTCRTTTPEAPPKRSAPGGFGAVVTPRKIPERAAENVGEITPRGVEPPEVPTLPPAPQEASVPDNFPEGIPIPEGSEVLASQTLANKASSVVFATKEENAPKLFDLYKDEMASSGWGPPTQEAQSKDQSFLSFKKGKTITNISITKDPRSGRRVVAVMYYEEEPLPFPEF
jgi:hypothetical protein